MHSQRLIFILFLVALIVPNVLLSFTEHLTPAAILVNVVLPLGVYGVVLSLSPNVGRTVWILFPVVFLAAFQIVLLSLYGRSVIAVDMFLNLTTTNPGEAGELLANLWPTLIVVGLLYVPPLALGVYLWHKKIEFRPSVLRRGRRGSMVMCGLGLAGLAVCFAADKAYSMRTDLYPVNVGYNIGLAVNHSVKLSNYDATSRNFRFDARSVHPDTLPETYVLIVGETSRADHWGLNGYERNTTPMLSGVYGSKLHNFSRAMSESNTTHKSVPLLLSHLTPATYGDSIYAVKSIIYAFREAGFTTAFISCQRRNGSFIDFFGAEADTCLFIRELDGLNIPDANDMTLARTFDRYLRSDKSRKRLIVLHCYGSHFNYRDRYPREYARFTPDAYAEANVDNRDALVNAYDNTIAMTDRMLDHVLISLGKQPGVAAMVYTSDHGEDIFDDARHQFLHASPCPSFYQLRVPFLVWLSDSYRARYPQTDAQLARHAHARIPSNSTFFPTALDIAGVVTPKADATYSVASPRFKEHKRVYLNDHNEAVALTASGFTAEDTRLLSALDH